MFGLTPVQLLIFMVIALVLFGAKRLPEMGRGLGSGLREFRGGITGALESPRAVDTPTAESATSGRDTHGS